MRDRPLLSLVICALGALALAYNVRVYSDLWSPPKGQEEAPTGEHADAKQTAKKSESAEPLAELSEDDLFKLLSALPQSNRDPFRFAEAQTAAAPAAELPERPALVLQGTLVGTRRVAWINQRAFSEGDEVEGQLIERIEADRVLLRRGSETYPLWPAPR